MHGHPENLGDLLPGVAGVARSEDQRGAVGVQAIDRCGERSVRAREFIKAHAPSVTDSCIDRPLHVTMSYMQGADDAERGARAMNIEQWAPWKAAGGRNVTFVGMSGTARVPAVLLSVAKSGLRVRAATGVERWHPADVRAGWRA